ncbi:MAG: hypothetical protein U0Q22_08070 [Acidimicrobiales bacterium]
MTRRVPSLLAALVVGPLLAATACVPDAPAAPRWVSTRAARVTSPGTTVNLIGAWTDADWAASLELTSVTGGGGGVSLKFFPRSGADNSVLGSPQSVTPTVSPTLLGPIGEHIVALGGSTAVEFFRQTAGVWGSAGTFALPTDMQLAAMDDRWMVLRSIALNPGTEGRVEVYSVDASGPTVTVTLATTLTSDPAWPLALREGFGSPWISLDGNLMVVAAQGMFTPTPGGARVFRAVGGVWGAVASLGAAPGGPNQFAAAAAVDDGATVDRLALSPTPVSPAPPTVDVYADTGAGFVLEQSLSRDTADPDSFSGLLFGNTIALDGDVLAVTARGVKVPSAEVGHADVGVGYVQMFHRTTVGATSTWQREAEVGAFVTPAPADVVSMYPVRLQAVGSHVAVSVLVNPDPPAGCQFPCFAFGFEAWSFDRTT